MRTNRKKQFSSNRASLILLAAAFVHAAVSANAAAGLTPSKDTYIDSQSAGSNFGVATTMVSNDNGSRWRYAIFSFDISTVDFTVGGVKLELRDNAGNAGPKQYQIFGLLDAHDGWVESTLTWNGSADFRSGNTIDPADVYHGAALGTFNTAQNAAFTAFDATSGAHVDFINANRLANGGNNIVTYIIVDPLNDIPGSGWATKETGGGLPPATLTLTSNAPDTTPPTLAGSNMIDDVVGDSVAIGTMVTYTLTFSEPMNAATLAAADFGNAGTAPVSMGDVTAGAPGVFTVQVTPSGLGTLRLMVLAGAGLADLASNPLDTASAIVADGSIEVVESPPPPVLRNLRVFLVGGQSNADGRAAVSGLPTSPINLQLPQQDIDFYYKVEGRSAALTTLRPGLSETNQFGPEITLGRRLADALAGGVSTRIALIKYANGGTNLHTQWKGGGNATTTGDGSEYLIFQQTVSGGRAALAAAYPGTTITIEGMLWVQGESDAGAQAVNYQANLTTFIADIRATYGNNLRFIISRLSSAQTAIDATSLATIRAAQSAVALANPLNTLLDTDSFGTNTDRLHFSALGQQQIGNGAAGLLLNYMPFASQPRMTRQPGDDFKIRMDDVFPGFQYTLRSSETLLEGSWQFEETRMADSVSIEFLVSPDPPESRRFYRVERNRVP